MITTYKHRQTYIVLQENLTGNQAIKSTNKNPLENTNTGVNCTRESENLQI